MSKMWTICGLLAGIVVRWWAWTVTGETGATRPEVATALNSWKRLAEGVFLYEHGIDPYQGDMFHESPLMLFIFHILIKNVPQLVPSAFILMDILTGVSLYSMAGYFMKGLRKNEQSNKGKFAKDCDLIPEDGPDTVAQYVLAAYLLNPYSIINCAAMTTTVIANFTVSCALSSMVRGRGALTGVLLAIAAFHQLYPVLLIVPGSMLVAEMCQGCKKCSYIKTCTIFVLTWGALIYISAWIMNGSYDFLENTYGFILNVPDLKPNIGLFWYFFTEMFEHFRPLFICAFQINALILYVVPLSVRLNKEPMLVATTLISLTTIFRAYPSIGDVALYLALTPLWIHLFPYMQQKFVVFCFMIVTSALGPTVWHLWIYSRSANANFFFGVTLAFGTAQIFLMTDILFAYIKREYALKHGTSREIDGKPAKLMLR